MLVNGDSCLWPAINWVHYVHHAWDEGPPVGPLWFRAKQNLNTWLVRKREMVSRPYGPSFYYELRSHQPAI